MGGGLMNMYAGASLDERIKERKRFNALTVQKAKAILEQAEGREMDFRSCMYCNGAHHHLKDRIVRCFSCGEIYVFGWPSFVLALRSTDELVTDQHMTTFAKCLDEAL